MARVARTALFHRDQSRRGQKWLTMANGIAEVRVGRQWLLNNYVLLLCSTLLLDLNLPVIVLY